MQKAPNKNRTFKICGSLKQAKCKGPVFVWLLNHVSLYANMFSYGLQRSSTFIRKFEIIYSGFIDF